LAILIHKLSRHITVLELPRFQFPYCNCVWIDDDRTGLIDSSPPADGQNFLKDRPIDLMLQSHGHLDHYFLTPYLNTAHVYMHPADQPMAQSADAYLEEFGFNLLVSDKRLHKMYMEAINYRTITVTDPLYEGQVFDLGHVKVEVMHLPGHSAGHCGFFFPEQDFVFTADLDLSAFGPWYGNLKSNIADLLNSLDRLLELKPGFVVSGHGPAIVKENVPARLKAYRDIILYREQRILDCIRRGHHTLPEIARCLPCYQKLPPPEKVFLLYEYIMDMAHLDHLIKTRRLGCENGHYFLK
jgi:glyoxylase-like metal-dependent hydrolase (beta-lactamase superfamily II)